MVEDGDRFVRKIWESVVWRDLSMFDVADIKDTRLHSNRESMPTPNYEYDTTFNSYVII